MIYKIIPPSPHLRAFIKDYLLLHFVFDEKSPVPEKPFPATTLQCLVFYINGSVTSRNPGTGRIKTFPPIAVNGSITTRLDFKISNDCLLLSIAFHPGALSKFLRLPMSEFVDERVDAEAMLNPGIRMARERMANAGSYEQIIQIAEEFLWRRIENLKTDFHPIDQVARSIADHPNAFTIEELADCACLSISQFERRFVEITGITPKLFIRIARFYSAFQLKERNLNADWLSIALETGYHDYQHLAKDFKQFASSTPVSLLQAQAQSPERILGIG